MSIVGWCRYGDRSGATHICVTQLVGECLELVSRKVIIVPENVVVRWSTCALNASVTAQIKVELGGMRDACVDRGAGWYVTAST